MNSLCSQCLDQHTEYYQHLETSSPLVSRVVPSWPLISLFSLAGFWTFEYFVKNIHSSTFHNGLKLQVIWWTCVSISVGYRPENGITETSSAYIYSALLDSDSFTNWLSHLFLDLHLFESSYCSSSSLTFYIVRFFILVILVASNGIIHRFNLHLPDD